MNAQQAANRWAEATRAAGLNYFERAPIDLDRLWDDYKRWYVEGVWTFERFCQAIDDSVLLAGHRPVEPYGDDTASGEILPEDSGKSSRRP